MPNSLLWLSKQNDRSESICLKDLIKKEHFQTASKRKKNRDKKYLNFVVPAIQANKSRRILFRITKIFFLFLTNFLER